MQPAVMKRKVQHYHGTNTEHYNNILHLRSLSLFKGFCEISFLEKFGQPLQNPHWVIVIRLVESQVTVVKCRVGDISFSDDALLP